MKSAGIYSDNKGEKMTGKIFTQENDGFIGACCGGPADSKKAVILMLVDSSTDRMARCGAGWVIARGCHALAMSAGRKEREIP